MGNLRGELFDIFRIDEASRILNRNEHPANEGHWIRISNLVFLNLLMDKYFK